MHYLSQSMVLCVGHIECFLAVGQTLWGVELGSACSTVTKPRLSTPIRLQQLACSVGTHELLEEWNAAL